jgi:heme/copper-type cytochrome/quinol oxidase subunit 2
MNISLFYFTVLVVLVFTLSIVLFSIHSAIGQMDKSQKYIKPIPLNNTIYQWSHFFHLSI